MRHFPIFVDLDDRRVVISGAGETAVAKLRLLMRTGADIFVYGTEPDKTLLEWAKAGKLTYIPRPLRDGDADGATLFYAANDDAEEDARAASIGRAAGAMTNIVDNLADSQFITAAMVDRAPVTVAIGTEGAAPVLARKIKQQIEEMLPTDLGLLTRIGQGFRKQADRLPMGRVRRDFWSKFYFQRGPNAFSQDGPEGAERVLDELLEETLTQSQGAGHVHLLGAGPGDPELLTLKARNLLHEADVVLHDALVPPAILELARREAKIVETGKRGFGPSWKQKDINALMIAEAAEGHQVVRLKSGDPVIYGRLDEELEALEHAGIAHSIVPGITAASAAAASVGQSLTKRGRNSSLRILTGHDINGFADQDWVALAAPGAAAAIYMGKRAAKFLRGRLLMFGADEATPVTIVEHASQPQQRSFGTTLIDLPDVLESESVDGPAVILFGIAPRNAASQLTTLPAQMEQA